MQNGKSKFSVYDKKEKTDTHTSTRRIRQSRDKKEHRLNILLKSFKR